MDFPKDLGKSSIVTAQAVMDLQSKIFPQSKSKPFPHKATSLSHDIFFPKEAIGRPTSHFSFIFQQSIHSIKILS
jgi:hypothetical protein